MCFALTSFAVLAIAWTRSFIVDGESPFSTAVKTTRGSLTVCSFFEVRGSAFWKGFF